MIDRDKLSEQEKAEWSLTEMCGYAVLGFLIGGFIFICFFVIKFVFY